MESVLVAVRAGVAVAVTVPIAAGVSVAVGETGVVTPVGVSEGVTLHAFPSTCRRVRKRIQGRELIEG